MRPGLLPCCTALALLLLAPSAQAQRAPAVSPTPPACSDFYSHANADWLRQNPLPSGSESTSRWQQMEQLAERQFAALLASPAPATGPASILLADLAASALDEATVERSGVALLTPLYAQINALRRNRDLAPLLAVLDARGLEPLFTLQHNADVASTPTLQPRGLGLPDPAFYSSAEPAARQVEAAYRSYLGELLRNAGVEPAQLATQTDWVLAIERELAQPQQSTAPSMQTLDDRPARKAHAHLPLEALRTAHALPGKHWQFSHPGYFQTLQRLLDKTPIAHWQAYLRVHVGHALAPYLGKAYREPHERLFVSMLEGRSPATMRNEWLTRFTTNALPGLLDAAYQERYLSAARWARAETLAAELRRALAQAIDRSLWLGSEGKAAARARLDALHIEIGQPALPAAFEGLRFSRDQLAGNVLALRLWQRSHAAAAGRAWSVAQWQPRMLLVPDQSRLLVTAALLQPPVLADVAAPGDYGSFAALVGQQLGHAFQTWNGADAIAWQARSQALIGQYNAFPATGGIKVNGVRTFAHNQADLVGLELAQAALLASGASDTAAQRAFFAGWASLWPRRDTDAAVVSRLANSPHAPAKWRVNGPLMNLPAFALAYGCKGRDAMLRPGKDQVALWR